MPRQKRKAEDDSSVTKRRKLAGDRYEEKVVDKDSYENVTENLPFGLQWQKDGTLLVLTSPSMDGRAKVAMFDKDDTLTRTKSGKAFYTSSSDMLFLDQKTCLEEESEIVRRLVQLYQDGYKLVIYSNQLGITKGKQDEGMVKTMIGKIIQRVNVPLQVFLSLAEDPYRKPNVAGWNLFVERYNEGVAIDYSQSFYVGDAAGRVKPKDHSSVDLDFAYNIALSELFRRQPSPTVAKQVATIFRFYTPEEFFFQKTTGAPTKVGKTPMQVIDTYLKENPNSSTVDPKTIVRDGKELVLFCGPPATGKSTFARRYFIPAGYEYVNQDTLGSKKACLEKLKEALKHKSVVVDNTNPLASTRKEYMDAGRNVCPDIPIRCIDFVGSKELSNVMNHHRNHQTLNETKKLPSVVLHTFFSKKEDPSVDEGFAEVTKVYFQPTFETDYDRLLSMLRVEGK